MHRWRLPEPVLRYLPFAVVAVAGQLGALWPPGPTNQEAYVASCVLLGVVAALVVASGGAPRTLLGQSAVYMGSVSFLMASTGGVDSGFGGLLLVPVVMVALYGERRESVAVVAALLVAFAAASLLGPPHLPASTPRRVLLTGAIAVLVSVGIQTLRRQLVESNERTKELLHHEEAINTAARQLGQLSEPPQITALGAQLAWQIAVPSEPAERRVAYFRVDRDMVSVEVPDAGGGPARVLECWPVEQHPGLRDAVASGEPVVAAIDPGEAGPQLREILDETGIRYGAWVPVRASGALHGVLAISSSSAPIPTDCVNRCVALASFLELALSNWAAHEKLEQQATAEERRRIARELHDGLAHELAFIASKTRGCAQPRGRSETDLRALAGAADRALDEARRAITVLSVTRPQSLDDAIAQTAEDLGSRLGVVVDLDLDASIEVPGEVRENLLRILREAMTNAAVHGAPRRVRVSLTRGTAGGDGTRTNEDGATGLRLVVEDDGCGFDPAGERAPESFGLQSMRERAESLGAVFEVDSVPSHGTRVAVAIG